LGSLLRTLIDEDCEHAGTWYIRLKRDFGLFCYIQTLRVLRSDRRTISVRNAIATIIFSKLFVILANYVN
jgi:hypothetical protein